MSIRKVDPAPYIRKAQPEADPDGISRVSVVTAGLAYGRGDSGKVSRGTLAGRTDEAGNLAPYAADDPDVLRELFGMEAD